MYQWSAHLDHRMIQWIGRMEPEKNDGKPKGCMTTEEPVQSMCLLETIHQMNSHILAVGSAKSRDHLANHPGRPYHCCGCCFRRCCHATAVRPEGFRDHPERCYDCCYQCCYLVAVHAACFVLPGSFQRVYRPVLQHRYCCGSDFDCGPS